MILQLYTFKQHRRIIHFYLMSTWNLSKFLLTMIIMSTNANKYLTPNPFLNNPTSTWVKMWNYTKCCTLLKTYVTLHKLVLVPSPLLFRHRQLTKLHQILCVVWKVLGHTHHCHTRHKLWCVWLTKSWKNHKNMSNKNYMLWPHKNVT